MGPIGDKGDIESMGPAGANGRDGTNGINGQNGRNGADGNGVHLALRDNSGIRGLFMQYAQEGENQLALLMMPDGSLIYADVNTGQFGGGPTVVYFSEDNCVGTAYTGRSDSLLPNTKNRIYVGKDNSGNPVVFYKAEEWVNQLSMTTKSYRQFNTVGQMNVCVNIPQTGRHMVRVVETAAPDSLTSLAPLQFTF